MEIFNKKVILVQCFYSLGEKSNDCLTHDIQFVIDTTSCFFKQDLEDDIMMKWKNRKLNAKGKSNKHTLFYLFIFYVFTATLCILF